MKKHFNHDEVMALKIFKAAPDAGAYAHCLYGSQDGKSFDLVALAGAIPEPYQHLLIASALMYQTLDNNLRVMQTITEAVEANGNDEYAMQLMKLSGAIQMTMQVALIGVDNFNKSRNVPT